MPVGIDKFGTKNSSTGDVVPDLYPYYKYTWQATFEFADGENEENDDGITLKTFELPRWTIDTQVINVYNHKTLVQTKLNWEPITISFYDQQNDRVEKLIWDFVQGQFDPTDGSKAPRRRPLKVTVKLHKFSGGDFDSAENKTYVLENAYIIDAQHDTLDYSVSDPVLWTVSIRYESLVWEGEFEGDVPPSSAGVPPKPTEPKAPGKIDYTPPLPDIPDASPGMLEMMDGNTGGAVNYDAVNTNPTGLARVLDQQRSREKASRQITPPGGDSEPTYTGYEGGFVPTPPGEGAAGFSPSTGTASSSTNTDPDLGSRRVERPSATSTTASRSSEPETISPTETAQIRRPARSTTNSAYQQAQDELKARQTGQTVAQVRAARARNLKALDSAVPDNTWY